MLNTVVLQGRLVADPDLRNTPNNVAVASFTVAVERSYVKSGKERQADFIDVTAWRNTAEFISKHFSKGQLIAIRGEIRTRLYQDKDGNNRKAVEVIADQAHFCESARRNRDDAETAQGKAAGGMHIEPDENGFIPLKTPSSPRFDVGNDPRLDDEDLPF